MSLNSKHAEKCLYIAPDKKTQYILFMDIFFRCQEVGFFNIKPTVKSKSVPKIYPTNLLLFFGIKREAFNLTIGQ